MKVNLTALHLAACLAIMLSACNHHPVTSTIVHFNAHGTEPFWAVEADGNVLVYKTPEDQTGRTWNAERRAVDGGIEFSGSDGGTAFRLTISDGECSDGMSDEAYDYSATLVLGSDTFTGCAERDD